MNPTKRNQSTLDDYPEITNTHFEWQSIVLKSRNQAGTERFHLVLRWRPARPKQSNSNRNQSMTGESSQDSTGVDCCKQKK